MGKILGMLSRTLNSFLWTALLLPAVTLANSERGVCMPEIQREADRHRAYVMRGLEQLEQTIAKLDDGIDSMAAGAREPERLAASLRAVLQAARPSDAIDEFVDKPVTLVTERYGSTSKRSNCPSDLKVSNFFVAFRRSFDNALLSPEYEIERRLAAENVSPDEGLVIVSFMTNFPFDDLIAKRTDGPGEIRVRPKRSGEHHIVLAARPGEYRWKEIRQSFTTLDLEFRDFTFSVAAGKINYIGMLRVEKSILSRFFTYNFDRQAYVLTRIEDRMPELLDRFTVFNGLNPDDFYTEFYSAERQRQARASD